MTQNLNYYNGFKIIEITRGFYIDTRIGKLYCKDMNTVKNMIDYWKETSRTIEYLNHYE